MKNSKAGNLSATISLVIIGFYLVIFIFFSWFYYQNIHWLFLIFSALLLFIFSYFVLKLALEKFINEKIRPIYKTIFNLKAPKDKAFKQQEEKSDIISSVNQQVIQWAEDKKEEIEELKKLEAYRREFLGNVSHELKTPIFNIQGYVLTLLDGGLDDPEINKEYLLRTEKSINRMINIVEDLEAISKLESGELKINYTRFDLTSLVKEVFEFLELSAKKKSIKFLLDKVYEKPVMVEADKEKIRQVLINLVDNSIKYGNTSGTTKVSFFDMDENMLIEVTDNGVGVAKQDIPRLFERFYRTDKGRSREQGGTGLGLAIVKHIIEAHRQTINVRSTVGVGTTFAFTLKKG
jgi:two-component system, OmpR family, phosphate regulon sensor histidine kinase PhoR